MSQQPSYPTPWSRLPGRESLQPLTWEEGGAQDAEQDRPCMVSFPGS